MKKFNKNLLLALLLVCAVLLSACGSQNQSNTSNENTQATDDSSYYPVTITTYNYAKEPVEMVFEKAPEKVVAIYQSPIETMLALGLGDKVVAAVQLDDPVKDEWKEQFDKIAYYENLPSVEEVLALEPDFILSWTSLFSEKNYGDISTWNDRGIKTYIWQNSGIKQPNTLDNEFEDILNIGRIFNVEAKATEIVEQMKSEIDKAVKYVEGKEKVRAIIIEVAKDGQYRVYGEDSIGGDIASRVGADLVAKENGTIGKEDLVNLNPDVIFTVYYGDSIVREQSVESIVNDEALASISAIQNNRVHPIVLSEVYASGVRTYDGIKTIIAGLYPDLV